MLCSVQHSFTLQLDHISKKGGELNDLLAKRLVGSVRCRENIYCNLQ